MHRDIKLDNIMIFTDPETQKESVKMIDFGLATILGLTEKALDWCGTLTYSSPEIIDCRPYN